MDRNKDNVSENIDEECQKQPASTTNNDGSPPDDGCNTTKESPRPDTTAPRPEPSPQRCTTRTRANETTEQTEERLKKMCAAVKTLLECVGEDSNRPGLTKTPTRYAKALLSLTESYEQDVEEVTNGAVFREEYKGILIVKDIVIHSLCEHHLLPFVGKMHIGISKLARVATVFARRLQIQERLTDQVAHAVMDVLKPKGVAVVMESSHLCMVMRGVGQTSAMTMTNCLLGCFENKLRMRKEFFGLLGIDKA
ncbi:hypothetical protein Q7P37_009676 [Cladosporium fusiforme]